MRLSPCYRALRQDAAGPQPNCFVACVAAWHVAKPNVVVMHGDVTDNNATLFASGYNGGAWTGSGIISSHGECTNVIEGGCDIREFNLDEVLATPVKVDEIQKRLFAIESFDQIYEAVQEAEKRLVAG